MLSFNEAIDQLAGANRMNCYGHVLLSQNSLV